MYLSYMLKNGYHVLMKCSLYIKIPVCIFYYRHILAKSPSGIYTKFMYNTKNRNRKPTKGGKPRKRNKEEHRKHKRNQILWIRTKNSTNILRSFKKTLALHLRSWPISSTLDVTLAVVFFFAL